jgi:Kef-type K+ transport system membrane component KefB
MTPIMGELAAGVVLGPTVFGALAPAWQKTLFPPLGTVNGEILTSFFWVGLTLLMFLGGLEIEMETVRRHIGPAFAIALGTVGLAFATGVVFAGFLPADLFPSPSRLALRLYFANALAITAIPMLIKILTDLKLFETRFGKTVVLAGVIIDTIGWLVLAIVTRGTTVGFSFGQTLTTCGLIALFLGGSFLLSRFVLSRLAKLQKADEALSIPFLASVLALMLLSAAVTERLHIHPVLGAFVVGLMVGTWGLSHRVKERLSDFAFSFFIPILLATLGMRANLLLINSWQLWGITALIAVVMCGGKYVGGGLGAKLTGFSWAESAAVGAAVNTKGVLGLVAAKAGFDLGFIPPNLYAMLVVVSLALTFVPVVELQRLKPRLFRLEDRAAASP